MNEPHCCAVSTGKNKVTAGFLYHNTKIGSLCSIRHSHFTTKVPIYLFFFSFFFFLETLSYQMSMNAVTLISSVFTIQKLKEKAVEEYAGAFSTLFTHIELVVYRDCQVPFHKAAPQPGRPQVVLHSWIMFSQVQDFTLVLIEPHKVLVSPLFQPIQVFLQGGSPFRSVHFSTQFGIISKLHQGTLDPITQITYEDIKQRGAQY
ncbi:hypothetical protein QYF61_027178 [Mycteria americana]|uniref:Uncharacterized protein n=1 Tax=Mycteria americana TaxID=33587 RepID=A0AAN7P155_MYCAM|nr:hypothetical protein QYF61_027178 [Mycteria americana]